jgi:mannose-1-phosphate guanylyltransferase/mannose-6-phosphate isomerase
MRDREGERAHMSEPEREPPVEMPPVAEVERPWGAFRQYALNEPVTVSLMTVRPGQRLSLQSHRERSELWIVLDEGAVVRAGDATRSCRPGEEVWIPAGTLHRLSCAGHAPVRVLEVAFGRWDLDDITRFDDDYDRDTAPLPDAGREPG